MRERAILDHIERAEKQKMFCAEHLTTGDFILFNSDGRALIVIERKTWNDFADSIKDGRAKNIAKLLAYREQTGARIAYLIDGKCAPREDASFHNIPYRNIRAHLDHLLYRDGIIELHANGPESVCARLKSLARNISTLKEPVQESAIGGDDHANLARRSVPKTKSEIRAAALMTFPYLGPVGARALSAHSLANIFDRENTLSLLEKAKIPKAEKIAASMDVEKKENQQHFRNCLAAIPQMSHEKAGAILDAAPMSRLVSDWTGAAVALRADKSLKLGPKTLEKMRAMLYDT